MAVDRIAYKPEEAAELLGVSLRTIQDATKDGTLPVLLIGSLRRYSRAALERWADEESVYMGKEDRGGKTRLGHGVHLSAPWGQSARRGGERRPRTPKGPLPLQRAGGEADVG